MPLAIGYVLRGEPDFAGENVLIAAAPPSPPERRAQGRETVQPAPPATFLSTDAVPDLWLNISDAQGWGHHRLSRPSCPRHR